MSKGSGRRPTLISQKEADDNWRAAFGPSRLERMVQDQALEEAKKETSKETTPVPDVPTAKEAHLSDCS